MKLVTIVFLLLMTLIVLRVRRTIQELTEDLNSRRPDEREEDR